MTGVSLGPGVTVNLGSMASQNTSTIGNVNFVGTVSYAGDNQLNGLTYTIAPDGTNVCRVSMQILDVAGNPLAGVFYIHFYLSDAASGIGIAAHAASGGISAVAGSVLNSPVAGKLVHCTTDATGLLTLAITDTAKTAYYCCCNVVAKIVASRQLTSGDYGV